MLHFLRVSQAEKCVSKTTEHQPSPPTAPPPTSNSFPHPWLTIYTKRSLVCFVERFLEYSKEETLHGKKASYVN